MTEEWAVRSTETGEIYGDGYYGDEGRAQAEDDILQACKGFGGPVSPDEAVTLEVICVHSPS